MPFQALNEQNHNRIALTKLKHHASVKKTTCKRHSKLGWYKQKNKLPCGDVYTETRQNQNEKIKTDRLQEAFRQTQKPQVPDKHVAHLYVHGEGGAVLGGVERLQHALIVVVLSQTQFRRLIHGAQAFATHLALSDDGNQKLYLSHVTTVVALVICVIIKQNEFWL